MEAIRNQTVTETCSGKEPLPAAACFSTKTRPFPIPLPWLALVKFGPNISRIYTPQHQSPVSLLRSTPMKMERIVSSETSALKAQTPGDYLKGRKMFQTFVKLFILTFRFLPYTEMHPVTNRLILFRYIGQVAVGYPQQRKHTDTQRTRSHRYNKKHIQQRTVL